MSAGTARAAFAVAYWLAYNVWWNWNGLDPRTGLPLQLCDFNGLMAPLAHITGWRWARASLYFWMAALTMQAFVQPALTEGPDFLVFWALWTAHTLIAAGAVYDVVVLGFRPGRRDSRSTCGANEGRANGDLRRLFFQVIVSRPVSEPAVGGIAR